MSEEASMDAKSPSALLAKPWRKLEKNAWTSEANEKLKGEIQKAKLTKEARVSHINVLLVGEISAGKSSFLNSVESVFTGHVTNRAGAGHGGGSLTTQYRQYKISSKGKEKNPIKFRFCDSMGLEGGEAGLSAHDIGKILDGHVQDTAELSGLLVPGKPGYNEHPTEEERIHCLAFVFNASSVSLMDEDLIKKMKAIRAEAKGRNLNPIVILTNVDRICPLTEDETRRVFHSKEIDDKVHSVSDVFGFTLGQIYPVCNYSSEIECDEEKDYLTLVAMRQILRYSGDYLRDKVARLATKDKILKQEMADMKKREKGRKYDDDSDDDESDEEDEEEQDTGSNSDESVEEEKPKGKRRNRNNNPPGDFPDSDYLPRRGKGKKGLMPSATPPAGSKGASSNTKRLPPTPPKKTKQLQALYDYEAEDEGDVNLFNGEVVDIVKEDDNGWTMVKKEDGAEGVVPTSYLGDLWIQRPPPQEPKRPSMNKSRRPPPNPPSASARPHKAPSLLKRPVPAAPEFATSHQTLPSSSAEVEPFVRPRPKAPPVVPPQERKPSRKIKGSTPPPPAPPLSSPAASSPPPPPPPSTSIPSSATVSQSKPQSKPHDLMQAIREAGINALKPAKTKDPKKSKDTDKAPGDFMSALKTELGKRRLGVEPSSPSVHQPSSFSSFMKNIPFEATEEVEDDSDFDE